MQTKEKPLAISVNADKDEIEFHKVDQNIKRGSIMSQNTNSTTPWMKK